MKFNLFLHGLDFGPLVLSVQLAFVTTLILTVVGFLLSLWFAFSRHRFVVVLEAITSLPLSVIGFYLLLFMGSHGWLGQLSIYFTGHSLAFSFTGLVIGSVLYSLPFAIAPMVNSFRQIGSYPFEVAFSLGTSYFESLRYVILPLCWRSILGAAVLCFAHTIGEFGVVLMIGGSIPNQTRVASVAIYDLVEQMDYVSAHQYSLVVIVMSLVLLLIVYRLQSLVRR